MRNACTLDLLISIIHFITCHVKDLTFYCNLAILSFASAHKSKGSSPEESSGIDTKLRGLLALESMQNGGAAEAWAAECPSYAGLGVVACGVFFASDP